MTIIRIFVLLRNLYVLIKRFHHGLMEREKESYKMLETILSVVRPSYGFSTPPLPHYYRFYSMPFVIFFMLHLTFTHISASGAIELGLR